MTQDATSPREDLPTASPQSLSGSPNSEESSSSEGGSRKRAYSEGPGLLSRKQSVIEDENPRDRFHLRFLVRSQYCSRILGHGARRLQELKERASPRKSGLDAWISRAANTDYRVMHAVGNPESVAKFVGLITRVILEEPDDASGSHSKTYTLLVLMPHPMMGRLIGSRMAHFKEIERQSAAHLSADHNKLPNSDDRLVYVAGVADSLHIAVYHLGVAYLRDPQRKTPATPFEPSPGVNIDIRDPQSSRERTIPKRPSMGDLAPRKSNDSIRSQVKKEQKIEESQPNSQAKPQAKLQLPLISNNVPPALLTAYEVARESHKEQLRQCVPVKNARSDEVETLIGNIRRVTKVNVETVDDDTLALSGAPEENTLALYLVYRFLREAST